MTGRSTVFLAQLLFLRLYKGLKLADLYYELFQLYMYLVSSAFVSATLYFIMLVTNTSTINCCGVRDSRLFILENTSGLH